MLRDVETKKKARASGAATGEADETRRIAWSRRRLPASSAGGAAVADGEARDERVELGDGLGAVADGVRLDRADDPLRLPQNLGHNYIGHNYRGHNHIGHDCMGDPLRLPQNLAITT